MGVDGVLRAGDASGARGGSAPLPAMPKTALRPRQDHRKFVVSDESCGASAQLRIQVGFHPLSLNSFRMLWSCTHYPTFIIHKVAAVLVNRIDAVIGPVQQMECAKSAVWYAGTIFKLWMSMGSLWHLARRFRGVVRMVLWHCRPKISTAGLFRRSGRQRMSLALWTTSLCTVSYTHLTLPTTPYV